MLPLLIRSLACGLALGILTSPTLAEQILYQSATLGPTGITPEQLTSQEVPGTNVNQFVFVGTRFELTQPSITSRVGGHFAQGDGGGGDFFGAIVQLDGADDFPDSSDLSTPDVLGVTLLEFPENSAEVFGDLSLTLQPGWYGVVFGSGLYQALGSGSLVENGSNINLPRFIGRGDAGEWGDGDAALEGSVFQVQGMIVPEPQTLLAAFAAILCCAMKVK